MNFCVQDKSPLDVCLTAIPSVLIHTSVLAAGMQDGKHTLRRIKCAKDVYLW